MNEEVVGKPMDRVDGRLKVTGGSRYSAEIPIKDLAYAVLVQSKIACGQIRRIDTIASEQVPGVLAVLTPMNTPRLPPFKRTERDQELTLLQDDRVHYDGQPIAVVIANTLERATHAATLLHVDYHVKPPITQMRNALASAYAPESVGHGPTDSRRGNLAAGLAQAAVRIEATYTTPVENHNPMEPHATLAVWQKGDHLTVYDSTQGIFRVRDTLARRFGLPLENVRVVCHFVGGGFGSKSRVWSHVVIAALAARHVDRPVKLVLSRQQMFAPVGMRPETVQQVTLGATRDGILTALRHGGTSQTSVFDEYVEPVALATRILYACPNVETSHRLVRVNMGTPTIMRAPGEATGSFAIESAIDELAVALHIDPIELRIKNYPDIDPESRKPWSSNSLCECFRVGAERFGWSRRTSKSRSMRKGNVLVGYGVAAATYPTNRVPASALARILPDGTALVQAGSQDLGTGTYTVMTQVAADALGLPPQRVRCELGDTRLPETPTSGGSQTAASVGSAVHLAALAVRSKVTQLALSDAASPLYGAREEDVLVENGRLALKSNLSRGETYTAVLNRHGRLPVEARVDAKPGKERELYSMNSFGAQFAEVHVDPDLGELHVARFVGVYGIGRLLNAKTAHSQLMGAVVFGLGMTLMEHTVSDPRSGRIVNANLAEYHVPVNADVGEIDVSVVDERDPHVNPLGVKGIGEIGIVGVAAAVANAVYHATGKRIRELPITPDKLL